MGGIWGDKKGDKKSLFAVRCREHSATAQMIDSLLREPEE